MSDWQLNEGESAFLAYLARRIDGEVDRWHRHEQTRADSLARIDRLSACALEILRSADELRAWLDAATQEPRLHGFRDRCPD